MYIAGHTHNLSDHGDVKGTAVLVSGAGSKLSELKYEDKARWAASTWGFVVFESSREALKELGDLWTTAVHDHEMVAPLTQRQ